ncbi:cytochrome P450 [Shimazuella sp. AN120528]|uniref:cytochrome P450 family protein n=1 Tax=Shimazuella soli TaxID=1892854 RepID=UPI001F0D03C1|nr:cytochrome P450 [Shimazuella soli]MCH5585594.1 cytochrome P450 [Shimazuella soli]
MSINIFSADFKVKSHQSYARMRKEQPIYPITLPGGFRGWLVTKYKHAQEIMNNPQFIKDPHVFPEKNHYRFFPDDYREFFMSHLLNTDLPDHTQLRRFVQPTFTPKAINRQEQMIEELTNKLIDDIEKQGKEFCLIKDFAFPLPFLVIAQMLGIPSKDMRDFQKWSNIIIEAINDPVAMKAGEPYYKLFFSYLKKLVALKTAKPEEDLISAWIQAREEGEKLSEDQLFGMIVLLILAGHETTVNLIGNSILALMQHREQWEELKQDNNLIPSALEEVLRFYSPIEVATARWAKEDIGLEGQQIRQGDTIFIVLASINRDEELVPDGDVFNIHRKPVKHMAFGHGIHYCLGAPLARLEGEIALRVLVNRMPNLSMTITDEQLSYRPGFLLRGLVGLPVRY